MDLIRQALVLLPVERRSAFWSTSIRTDAALAAIRRHPQYLQMEAEMMWK